MLLNIKITEGGILTDFAQDWLGFDPATSAWTDPGDAPNCLETNLQIRREVTGEDFEEIGRGTWESPPEQIRVLAEELSAAFGLQYPVLLPKQEA